MTKLELQIRIRNSELSNFNHKLEQKTMPRGGRCTKAYRYRYQLLRGTTVYRTCGTHKNLYVPLYLLLVLFIMVPRDTKLHGNGRDPFNTTFSPQGSLLFRNRAPRDTFQVTDLSQEPVDQRLGGTLGFPPSTEWAFSGRRNPIL